MAQSNKENMKKKKRSRGVQKTTTRSNIFVTRTIVRSLIEKQ